MHDAGENKCPRCKSIITSAMACVMCGWNGHRRPTQEPESEASTSLTPDPSKVTTDLHGAARPYQPYPRRWHLSNGEARPYVGMTVIHKAGFAAVVVPTGKSLSIKEVNVMCMDGSVITVKVAHLTVVFDPRDVVTPPGIPGGGDPS